MTKLTITDAAEAYVSNLLKKELDPNYSYHNLEHTLLVRNIAMELAQEAGLNGEDAEILHLAALFHDVGYLQDPKNHEKESQDIADRFLQEQKYDALKRQRVLSAIDATQLTVEPKDLLEKILQDADLSNLGLENYAQRLEDLRYEWAKIQNERYNEPDWLKKNIQFLKGHNYHSEVAQNKLGEQKKKNLKKLKKARKKLKKAVRINSNSSLLDGSKTAQMMFKTSLRNHIDLTNIADNKANIMLSINALIITIGMTLLTATIRENPFLLIPVSILLATCVISIIFATLATRPIKTTGQTDLKRIQSGQTNLFFFGNFYRMNLEDYKKGLTEVMETDSILDDTIMADLYYLGKSLGAKFNRLRICYAVFMVGVTLSVIAFAVAFLLFGP